MPTFPPRVPSSLKSALAGTVMLTPASAALLASTEGGNWIWVFWVALTLCKVPAGISGRKISPLPPARLVLTPAAASHCLPTNG